MRFFLLTLLTWISANAVANVHADFTADKFSGCPPLLVTFTNASQSSSNITYSWTFGNGNISTLENPSAAFNTPGEYHVQLIVSDSAQSDTIVKTITVFHLPQVDFHAIKTQLCTGDTLQLINDVTPGDTTIVNYGWGFGDGIASSIINPSHRYNHTGLYNITLVVQDANGCSANAVKNSYIEVDTIPVAAFMASPAISCNHSQSVSFTNTSSGTGLTYFWKLDNGISDTIENPTHTYIQEKYNVTLTVTDANGCKSSVVHAVSAQEIIPDFTSKIQACTGEEVQFTNTSNVSGSSHWDFGDGTTTSTTASPVKIYTAPGVYTVTLTQSSGPCSATVTKTNYITVTEGFGVSFLMDTPQVDCSSNAPVTINFTNTTPQGVSFYWNFGDGTHSTDENPSHTYNGNSATNGYLIVTDSNGCSIKSSFANVVSSFLPAPDFRADNPASCSGGAVYFHNRSTGASRYKWFFGDSDTSTDANPTHYYRNAGDYSVTLFAYNYGGCDSSVTKINFVHISDIQTDFSVDRTFSPCPPFVTEFTSSSNWSGLKYKWDFGDATTDTAANPTHIYFHPGIFTVKMMTSTSNGCVDTVTRPHLIEVQGPTGTFSAIPTSGCVPLTVNFGADISSNTANLWCDLGDGTLVSDSLQFSHTYTTANIFHPKFILVDHVGCTVPFDLSPIVVHELPALQLRDTFVCEQTSIPVSLGNDKYQWSPSTYLSCDTCANVTITPQANIVYKVNATNSFGCVASDTMNVRVDFLPVLASDSLNVCLHSSVNLFAGEAASVSWSPSLYLDDSTSLHPVCTPLQSTTYNVTAANSLGCSSSTQIFVNVIEKLSLNDFPDTTICAYDELNLRASVAVLPDDDSVHYTWLPNDFGIVDDNASQTISGLNRTMQFRVVASGGTCEADTANFVVHVLRLPDIEVSQSITTTPLAEVPLFASSHDDLNYEWTANDSLSCRECSRTNLYPTQSQTVYVTGTDSHGCKATDSVSVNVMNCDPNNIFLPNTFTPNNDGMNDRFFVRSKTLASLSYFRVFDEWGELIFETKDLNEGWDGTIKGKPAPTAVYVCMVGGKCENGSDVTKSSNITLIR